MMRAIFVLVASLGLSGCVSLIGGEPQRFDCTDGPATLVIYKNDARLLKGMTSYLMKPAPAAARMKLYQGDGVSFAMNDFGDTATLKMEGRPDVACSAEIILN